jgi:LacI family transcriptional regulator
MRLLLRDSAPVEVVFAVNDVMAVGAMAAAHEAGVRVPEDVAAAGFDDILTLRDITAALSSVRVPRWTSRLPPPSWHWQHPATTPSWCA